MSNTMSWYLGGRVDGLKKFTDMSVKELVQTVREMEMYREGDPDEIQAEIERRLQEAYLRPPM